MTGSTLADGGGGGGGGKCCCICDVGGIKHFLILFSIIFSPLINPFHATYQLYGLRVLALKLPLLKRLAHC